MKHKIHVKAELILVFVTILAGLGWIFSKETLVGLPPLFFIGVRFLLGGFVLVLMGGKHFKGLAWQDIKPALWIGTVMGLAMMFWITGLDQSKSLGVGAFISSLGVVLVPVVATFIFGDHPPRSIWLAVPVAMIGLGFLALSKTLHFELAHMLFLASAITSALQFNLLSRISLRLHFLVLTAVQLIVAGMLLLILSLCIETIPHTISISVAGWFLASTLIATCLRFVLQTYGQSLTPVSHAAVIMNLEPVWTALFAVLWFAEVMTFWQILGCFFVFLAMIISRWRQVREVFKSRHI